MLATATSSPARKAVLAALRGVAGARDARGVTAFVYTYDQLGRLLAQTGVDDGERRLLPDGSGKPAITWLGPITSGDAAYRVRAEYDVAERPTHNWLSISGASETLRAFTVWGEDAPGDPEDLNLLGRAWRTYDTAGRLEATAYDFKGNPLGSTRRLVAASDADPDWSAVAAAATLEDAEDEADLVLEAAEYSTSATFDALNRPMTTTTADNSVHVSTYGRGGALRGSGVKHRGSSTETPVVSDIDYNARGQRVSAAFGNGTVQTTTYDALTFRVRRIRQRRTADSRDLQDLCYTYDPEGNPTEIRDFAQQRTFFNNDVVYPSRRYAYDALYRLIRAEGRETAIAPTSPWSTAPTPEQPLRTGSDPAAMRRYIEHFSLDANGSLVSLEHIVPSSSGASWTRTMTYATGSNRLASYQGADGASVETPVHDALGRMTAMPGVDELDWDAEGRLRRTQAASGVAVETRYVYDGGGNRVRKARYEWVTDTWVKKTETIYVGGIDIEREFIAGEVEEEIETLHVGDAGRRLALVESRTIHEGEIVTTPTGKWRFQHDDHLHSSCVETNIDGVVISYEEYHAYGTTAYSAHTTALEERAKRYRYSGKERDEESGLYYYGARYLAPWIGRWISPDPAGTVDGVNLYGFVRGAPSAGWDADGRQDLSEVACGGGIESLPNGDVAGREGIQMLRTRLTAADHSPASGWPQVRDPAVGGLLGQTDWSTESGVPGSQRSPWESAALLPYVASIPLNTSGLSEQDIMVISALALAAPVSPNGPIREVGQNTGAEIEAINWTGYDDRIRDGVGHAYCGDTVAVFWELAAALGVEIDQRIVNPGYAFNWATSANASGGVVLSHAEFGERLEAGDDLRGAFVEVTTTSGGGHAAMVIGWEMDPDSQDLYLITAEGNTTPAPPGERSLPSSSFDSFFASASGDLVGEETNNPAGGTSGVLIRLRPLNDSLRFVLPRTDWGR